ncbi:MAG: Flp pilus assembly protein CpaB [Tepidiformaceae bacterium]
MARSIAAVSGSSGRNRGVLLLAAVFGILSAVLIFAFLKTGDSSSNNVNNAINAGAGAESVVVLARDVAAGEKITSDMLTTKTIPASALLTGHSTNMDDFVDKVAVQTLYAGEQVITAKVTSFDGEATLAYQVPEGLRALGLMVPHEGWFIGGLPQPGDRVDVVAITAFRTVDPLTGQEKPELVSAIIAQNVQVLAMGQTLVRGIPMSDGSTTTVATGTTTSGEESADGATREGAISATLALTPEQAAKLAMIDAMDDNEGQWRIIARRKGEDAEISGAQLWTLEDIFVFTR